MQYYAYFPQTDMYIESENIRAIWEAARTESRRPLSWGEKSRPYKIVDRTSNKVLYIHWGI